MLGITKDGQVIKIDKSTQLTGKRFTQIIIECSSEVPSQAMLARLIKKNEACNEAVLAKERRKILKQYLNDVKGAGMLYDDKIKALDVNPDELPRIIRRDFLAVINEKQSTL